jgi:hypothetical protein
MPRGVDITGQGVKFLVQMDMSQALKMLKDFETRFQNSERAVDTLSQQMQSQFGRLSNAMSEYIEDLNREPNMVSPGGATARQVEGMKKVQRLVEEMGTTMATEMRKANDGGRSLGNTFDTLTNTLKRSSEESRQLEKNLSDIADMGNALKSALAFVGLSVGIGAITHETVEWDKVLTKLELRLKSVGGQYKAIHNDIMKLSQETGGSAEEVAQLNTELLQMGISSRSAQRQIVTITEQMGQMFDVDKSGMARFFAQMSNLGLGTEKDMKRLGDTMAHLASDPNSGPGSTDQDIAAVQSRMGEIQKLRSFLRSEGRLTEDQLNETTNTLMEQIMVANRKLAKLGIDPEFLTNMLRLPEQFSEQGGQMSRGFLAGGFSQLGMQVNPEELMGEIKQGHLDKAMAVFDQAVAQMAKNPKLIEMVPNEFLQLLMGNLAGGDAKQLIAALENARASGRGLTKELLESVAALAKAHAEGSALDKLWARYKESLGKSWDDMVSTMGRLGKQLGIILAGPMKGLVDMVKFAAGGMERFLVWVQNSTLALRTMQGLFVVLAGATGIGALVRVAKILRDLWQHTAGLVGTVARTSRTVAPPAVTAGTPVAPVVNAGASSNTVVAGAAGAAAATAASKNGTVVAPSAATEAESTTVAGGAAGVKSFGSTSKAMLKSPSGVAGLGIGAGLYAYDEYNRVKGETDNTVQAAGAGLGAATGFVGGTLAGLEAGAAIAPFTGPAAPLVVAGSGIVGGMMGAWGGSSLGQAAAAVISPDDIAKGAERGVRAGMESTSEKLAEKTAGAVAEGVADAEQRKDDESRFGPGSDVPQTELGKKMQAVMDASLDAYKTAVQGYGTPIPVDKRYYNKGATGENFTPVPPEMQQQQTSGQAADAAAAGPASSFREDLAKRMATGAAATAAKAAQESELERQHAQALRDRESERQAEVARKLADPSTDEKFAKLLRDSEDGKRRAAEALIAQAEKASAEAKAKSERMAELAAGQQTPSPPAATAAQDASGTPVVAPPAATAGPAPTPAAPAATPAPQVTVNVDQSEVVDALKTLPGAIVDGWKQIQNMERARRAGGMGTNFEQ